MRPITFFRVGTKAVCVEEISHWWVAPGAFSGPELCVVMRNGKQVNFGSDDGAGDGYACEGGLLQFIEKVGRAS
jgi:hypothetical protein